MGMLDGGYQDTDLSFEFGERVDVTLRYWPIDDPETQREVPLFSGQVVGGPANAGEGVNVMPDEPLPKGELFATMHPRFFKQGEEYGEEVHGQKIGYRFVVRSAVEYIPCLADADEDTSEHKLIA